MPSESTSNGKQFLFQLFVAGREPHSKMAEANLRALCESFMPAACDIEIVDVLKSHEEALKNHIFLTPALIRISPKPSVTIYGDLSDTEKVMDILQWGEDA
ncbi:MAG: circadian clock KaiB family protein [Deltaproteobacteria bacterium]|jgi:circadian clock protein KaiB